MEKKFGKLTFDPQEDNFKNILDYSKENKKKEKIQIEKIENEKKLDSNIKQIQEELSKINDINNECSLVNDNAYYISDEEEEEEQTYGKNIPIHRQGR